VGLSPGFTSFHQSKSTSMLEKETELIVQILTERTIGARDAITLREVLAAEIPKGIKTYIQADVARWLKRGFKETPQYDRLGEAGPTSRKIVDSLIRSLAGEYMFERREFLATLDNAIHFVENYLCRPHWTLEHFVFEQAPRVDVETLRDKLEYIAEYKYLGSILDRFVRSNQWEEIHVDQFRSLLLKIDDQVVRQHNARETALLARPIYQFLLLGDDSPNRSIPIKPLLVFYEDKQMGMLKDYLERVCQIRNRTELSLNELAGIIADLYLSVPKKDEPDAPAAKPKMQEDDGTDFSRAALPDSTEQPVEGATSRPNSTDSTAGNDVAESEQPGPPLSNRRMNNLALSLTFAGIGRPSLASQQTDVPTQIAGTRLPGLEEVISEEQRSVFVKKVFKKDEAFYAAVIAALNSISTWHEASAYLQELFQMNGLDPYADEVIAFTDAIQQRYVSGKPEGE